MSKLRFITMLAFVVTAFAVNASAQVNVNPGAGSYPTLKGAFDAINAGTHTGTITIDIVGDTTETATAVLNASGSGAASYTSITISPSGGAARTISGAITAGSPLIDFNGADNVTVNGLNTGGNSLTISNTTVSVTSGTSTIRFQADATNNTITNSSILGSSTMATTTNGGNIWFAAAAVTTGNDNNIISNNNIGPAGANLPTKLIYGNGSTTTTASYNSGIQITGNNMFDFFNATLQSNGVYMASGNTDWTISNNRFYQTATRTQTTGTIHAPIQLASSNINNCVINGNIIGFANSAGTGTYNFVGASTSSKFLGIYVSTGGTTTASSFQGNTIAGINLSGVVGGTSTTSAFMGISIASGLANIGNVIGNTVGSLTTPGSISITSTNASAMEVHGIYFFPSALTNISNNNVGGMTVSNTGAGSLDVYGIRANTTGSATNTMNNNTVGSSAAGISNSNAATGSNTYGLYCQAGQCLVSGNVIRNLTMNAPNVGTGSAASAIGLWIDNTSATAGNNVAQNTIDNISNTNTTAAVWVTGLHYNGSTTGTHTVQRNNIHTLSTPSNSATATVNGINIQAGNTTYSNNMIALGSNMTAQSPQINGINETTAGTDNFYHNSVYIGGSGVAAGAANSFAFQSAITLNTRNYRDNIFFNARSNGAATGKHYAIRVGGTAANPSGLISNNNILFANGTGGLVGLFNAVDQATLANWQTATGNDANSFSVNPQFVDPTNATPDLHLSPTISTVAEANGFDVGVTIDFDGQTRSGLTPVDIGADAGNFMGIDLAPPIITYTALLNTSSTANRILAISVTDNSGVPTSGIGLPVIYYRKGNVGIFSTSTCSFVSGSNYNCVIDYSTLGGVSANDAIQYYVVAQDAAATPNVAANPSAGAGTFGSNPPSVAIPPTTPNQYVIVGQVSGTFNVGVGQTYTSLTNTGGIFELINNSEVVGNITINITSDLSVVSGTMVAETGTVALNEFASPYTVTIKPSGAPRVINGQAPSTALIRTNGASRVTIDGSLSGGTDRSLRIENLTAAIPQVVRFGSIGATPITANTLKNCVLVNGVNTSSAVVVLDTTGAAAGTFNNITIQNNDIQNAYNGIFTSATVAAGNGSGLLITQNRLDTAGANAIRGVGIYVQGADGATVSNNIVGNFNNTNDENDTGIWLAAGTVNTIVSGNTVTTLGYTGTSTFNPFGIRESSGATVSGNNISGNTVTTITSNGSASTGPTVFGIDNTGGGTIIQRNNVQGILATNTNTYGAVGINIGGGNNVVLRNNFVSDVNGNMTGGAAFSTTFGIFGIRVAAGTGHQIYNNSVNLYGLRAGTATTSLLTAAFGIVNTTSTGIDVRNNIFANNITGGTTSVANVAVFLPSGGTSAMNLTMNKNAYFYGTDAARQGAGQAGTTAGTNFFTSLGSLAAYSSALHGAATNDNASQAFTTAPPFVGNNDLHLNDPFSPLLGAGDAIGSVTNDYDNDPRPATNSDIGADELVQASAGSFPSGVFYNAVLGGGDTLSGNATVTNTLTLTGISNTGSSNLVIGCLATVNGAGVTNYIVGTVQKDFCSAGSFTFPVGTANDGSLVGEEYTPFTANVTAGTFPSALQVSVTDNVFNGMDPANSASRYWDVTEIGNLTADISFTYLDQDVNGNESLYKVLRREGGITTNPGGSVDAGTNTASITGVTNFSQWAAGNVITTAASANLSGRVMTAEGNGIRNAAVILTGGTLTQPRIVKTGAFGRFEFENLQIGQTYILTVESKRYIFDTTTRVINLDSSITDIDFVSTSSR